MTQAVIPEGLLGGFMGECKSKSKDCLQPSKMLGVLTISLDDVL